MDNYTTDCIHYEVCQRSNCHNKCQYFEERPQDLNETSCCGEQMWLDNLSWFADEYDEYVCHKCGKRKLIKKREVENA